MLPGSQESLSCPVEPRAAHPFQPSIMIMPQVRHVEAVIVPIGDAGNNCLGDLDIDGEVGIFDLLTLLAHWG